MHSPRPTVREFGTGSAMTLGVIRDEQLRFRIVVHVNDLLTFCWMRTVSAFAKVSTPSLTNSHTSI